MLELDGVSRDVVVLLVQVVGKRWVVGACICVSPNMILSNEKTRSAAAELGVNFKFH